MPSYLLRATRSISTRASSPDRRLRRGALLRHRLLTTYCCVVLAALLGAWALPERCDVLPARALPCTRQGTCPLDPSSRRRGLGSATRVLHSICQRYPCHSVKVGLSAIPPGYAVSICSFPLLTSFPRLALLNIIPQTKAKWANILHNFFDLRCYTAV